MHKKEMITHLRTGYDPKKQKALFEYQQRQQKQIEYKQMLHQVDEQQIFLDFIERLQQAENENISQQIDAEKKNNIEKSTQITLKKFMPNNFTSSFTVMRQKIEKLVEDGYSFKKYSKKQSPEKLDKEKLLQMKSPLEIVHEIKEQERLLKEEMEKKASRRQRINVEQILQSQLQGSFFNKKHDSSKMQPTYQSGDKRMSASPQQKIVSGAFQTGGLNENYNQINIVINENQKRRMFGSLKNKRTSRRFADQPSFWKVEFGRIRNERLRIKNQKDIKQSSQSINSKDDHSQASLYNKNSLYGMNSSKLKSQSPRISLNGSNNNSPSPDYLRTKRSNDSSPMNSSLSPKTLQQMQMNEFEMELQQIPQKDFITLNKEKLKNMPIKDHRPWSVQQPVQLQSTSIQRPDSKITNSKQFKIKSKLEDFSKLENNSYTPLNLSLQIDSQMNQLKPQTVQFARSTRHSMDNSNQIIVRDSNAFSQTGKRRNINTATGSMNFSTKASFISPKDHFQMMRQKDNFQQSRGASRSTRTKGGNAENSSINNYNYSQYTQSKFDNLSSIVNKCDTQDANWCKQTEGDREQVMNETIRQEEELKQAVDYYLDLVRIGVKETPKIQNILDTQKDVFEHDYSNFLAPNILKNFKEDNYNQTLSLMKDMSKRKIWQPDKFHISKKSDVADTIMNFK
eukprot:403332329